ncbi:MAG: riboflavin synthase [Candidatus Koribacter versatilis]|uniref:Riboflavin synthase n=1 Tax=Candidatus Korobacter versatilis TaxID=658062 RepID=A0A932A630_9BACT|nr:riboflavin synthase [Candidatus Koribacter versatilis]
MFTGLIEDVGQVAAVTGAGGTLRLTISTERLARRLQQGDSIAVSGVCLTAVDIKKYAFTADLAAETVARTSLSRLKAKTLVNLELPMKSGDRMGGHIVQGHVDGVGALTSLTKVSGGDDYLLRVSLPPELARYVVFKGSIAIEGISLTVAKIGRDEIEIAIIPHTFTATNLHALRAGDPLNIEVDVLAKYAERMLAQRPGSEAITLERLREEGF